MQGSNYPVLEAGDRVCVRATLCEPDTGSGALLVEVGVKGCTQRFWVPSETVGPTETDK